MCINHKISAVKAVGTDGKKKIGGCSTQQLPYILCFIHLQQNVEIQEQHFPASNIKAYVHDIFS